jgi:hypothetical protein
MTLERQGVPTATYVTHAFDAYARGLCRMQGLATLPIVVIPHPVAARPLDDLRGKIRDSYANLRKAIVHE